MRSVPLLACLLFIGTAHAQTVQGSDAAVLPYMPDQAVPLAVAPGFAVLVELGPDERIETVILGDTGGWQVTPTKRGDRFVVKPISGSTTDLIVTTTARRYLFLLRTAAGAGGPLVLRFDYPELAPPAIATSEVAGHYKFKGDKVLFPDDMHDDGAQTSLEWKSGTALPAVFAIGSDGQASLVNGRMVGGNYVIEGVAQRYLLQCGKKRAIAIRLRPKAKP